MSKKSRRERTRKKRMDDQETRDFLYGCVKCEHYTDGLCKKYNDLMDRYMNGTVPHCDGEPYRTKKGEVILIRI